MTGADRLQAEENPASARVRRIVLQSKHLGAHGMGYSNRSLSELSRKLSPADVPTLIALLADQDIRVGVQFALASQCQASIVPVRQAAKPRQMDFLYASDVTDLISGFAACSPSAKEEARAMREEIDRELFAMFAAYDERQDQTLLETIRGILNRRKYILNLVNQVEKAL